MTSDEAVIPANLDQYCPKLRSIGWAIAVLDQGADYRAEPIPWDAAPSHKMIPTSN